MTKSDSQSASRAEVSLGQIAITVSDVPRAVEFYCGQLGLQFLFSPAAQLAFVKCGEVRLMLSTPQGAGHVGANSILYFRFADISATFQRLQDSGVVGVQSPQLAAQLADHELWLAFVRDPDGNLVGLMEERR